ncbi:GNAT family N-acetyltransferase [Georgenia halophila]|uniref:GNAT family N-acetyltransferase n=1 Tax=Georgenia halophila TaxID=620889 RepID=A0ABP8LA13_9MICO
MTSNAEPTVRTAEFQDIAAITRFGEAHIRPHYAPLIGVEAADDQVRNWWNETHIGAAVTQALVVVTVADGQLLGVGQRGRNGNDHVIYKLYVHPQHRGQGVGPKLLDALTKQLPTGADRLYIEHVAANKRAGAFYEREGFTVERIEPSPTGDPELAQVWRVRQLRQTDRPLEPV